MELEQSLSVGDGEQGDFKLFSFVVEFCFYVNADSTGAFVEDGEQRFVIEKSSHSHTLFFST